MTKIKLLAVTAITALTLKSKAQISVGLQQNYMTDNNYTENWGFTIQPEYKLSQKVRLGIATSIFLKSNPFPDYLESFDDFNNNITAGTAHRLLPIDAVFKYHLSKNSSQKIQPHIQIHTGVAILSTFTKAEIISPSYQKTTKEKNTYFSSGLRLGVDYSLMKTLDLSINAGYTKVFSNDKNRFTQAPLDMTDYNYHFRHYFIFSAGIKYNLD